MCTERLENSWKEEEERVLGRAHVFSHVGIDSICRLCMCVVGVYSQPGSRRWERVQHRGRSLGAGASLQGGLSGRGTVDL